MKTRIEQLTQQIEKHDYNYWQLNNPTITDPEYDQLCNELSKLSPDEPILHEVHESVSMGDSTKVIHTVPMLSLDKVYSDKELFAWVKKVSRNDEEQFVIMPKLDGISADISGTVLSSRGNGSVGEDMSSKLCAINIQTNSKTKDKLRGEIVIKDSDWDKFKQIKRKDGSNYKNSRNCCAGILNGKDSFVDIKRQMDELGVRLTLIDFNYHSITSMASDFESRWLYNKNMISTLDIPMDGIVVALADKEYAYSLGYTDHHPKSKMAFKFGSAQAQSTVTDIVWQCGLFNLTPVAIIEPVELEGVTIERLTLHNAETVLHNEIAVGDSLTIERAGQVIPHLIANQHVTTNSVIIPQHCPECDSGTNMVGCELVCSNTLCKGKVVCSLNSSLITLGVEYFSEKTVCKVYDNCGVRNLYDLLTLTVSDLQKVDGFGSKSINKFLNQVITLHKLEDWKLLSALNIRGIGDTVAKLICSNFTLSDLEDVLEKELISIKGVGETTANALIDGWDNNSVEIEELIELLTPVSTLSSGTEVSKITVAFTGKSDLPRSHWFTLAENSGYEPVKMVNKELGMLVLVDVNSGSSKAVKARKLDIKIVDYGQFTEMCNKGAK